MTNIYGLTGYILAIILYKKWVTSADWKNNLALQIGIPYNLIGYCMILAEQY
ncbi:hypothetical protein [Oscillibacter ruminantium]|jgi:hypothetical protein|uniref:hypothetical protein n=1 Tax=Oscillibacter ruminantium TaxID=1263547 RepID=UPI003333A7AE